MIYRAVIDTNVLVSAMLKSASPPGNIMELVFREVIVPVITEPIVREYGEVLRRPKFRLPERIVRDVICEIERLGEHAAPRALGIELSDPEDLKFYEAAVAAGASGRAYLVTGNIRHFPTEPCVVTPRRMLDIIIEDIEGT